MATSTKDAALISMSNKSIIEYNASINKRLNEICKPWLEQVNVSTFTYIKFIGNNKRFFISTNHAWVTTYMQYKLYDEEEQNKMIGDVIFQKKNTARYALWDSFAQLNVLKTATKHNMYNGFFIFNNHELFSFSNHTNTTNNTLIYLNTLDYFEQFICFFKYKMKDVLAQANERAIITSPLTSSDITQGIDYLNMKHPLPKEANSMQFFLGDNFPEKYLTFAEFRCVSQLAKGKSMKEIANFLNISVRTVETYINNAKNKLECSSKERLLARIRESDLRFIL